MHVEKLNLEITRRCTLECEHCFRGKSENININKETLKNIFNNIKKIDKLIITGGEPLIAVNELEGMINLIKQYNIKIEHISIVTNGTILSSRILKILKELSNIADLKLSISYDIFHLLELEKKNLKQKRDENTKILKELFNAKEYGNNFEKHSITPSNLAIERIGRAKNLTQKRLDEINSMVPIKYKFPPFTFWSGKEIVFENNMVYGDLSIDVNGNIVEYGLSFEDEDMFAKTINSNINQLPFDEAINNFIKSKKTKNKNI